MLNSGDFDRRVIIQKRTASRDDYGEEIETWSDVAILWAQWLPLRAAEAFSAKQTAATIDGKFRIRYRGGITPLNRLIDTFDGNREYDIHGVLPIGRKEGLDLMVSARGE